MRLSWLVLVSLLGCARVDGVPSSPPALDPDWVLPGEFEPVEQLLLAWDDSFEDYQRRLLAASAGHVDVTIVVDPSVGERRMHHRMRGWGVNTERMTVVELPVDVPWVRDFGPLVVRDRVSGRRRIVDAHYFRGGDSDRLPARMAPFLGAGVIELPLEFEGGNLLSDGAGRCITTAGYREHEDSSTVLSAADVQAYLGEHFGCESVSIVPPLYEENTAHVDMFATITGQGQVLVGAYDPELDPINSARLDEAAEILVADGFAVRRVPMPDNTDGIFRSYTNSLALDDIVLVPVYDADTTLEGQAMAIFEEAYPARTLVPVESADAIESDGAIHCMTMTVARP